MFLKNKYLPHNEERENFTEDIPSQECQFTFKETSDSIKTFLKCIGEAENMSLKSKALLGGWISMTAKYSDARKICVERICSVDLKIGCIKTAAWKNKRYIVRKIFTSWWKLLQSWWIVE